MSKLNQCLSAARVSFNAVTADELEEYARDVIGKSRSYDDVKGKAAIERAIKEADDEFKQNFFEDAQTIINNENKVGYLARLIEAGKATIRDLVGTRWLGKGDNIEVAQKAAQNRMIEKFFGSLDAEDVAYLQNKENEMEIAKAFDGYRTSPQAEKIANNLKKYITDSNADMVKSGALQLRYMQNRRHLSAIHDRGAMLKGGRKSAWSAIGNKAKFTVEESKVKWVTYIKQKLDMEETFAHTDAIEEIDGKLIVNEKRVDEILSRTYDNIMNGRSEIFTKSAVLNDSEAIAKRSRMFFVWKGLKDFTEYNEVYGQGTLFDAIMHDAESKGRAIGRAELLGSDPDLAYTRLKDVQQKVNPKRIGWYNTTDNFYKEVRGDNSTPIDPTLANFGSNIRSYSSMSRLFALVASSLTDINMAAGYASRWGANYGSSMAKQLESVFAYGTSEERKELARMFHIELKSQMGFMGKFTDIENAGELTNKLSNSFYRINGMQRWDKGNRVGAMQVLSNHLGMNSRKGFDELSSGIQRQFEKHGIGKEEWDILRKYSTKSKNTEKQLFTLENVEKLTNADLKKLYDARGGTVPIHQLKNELYRKVFSIFEGAQENAILTPNAWAKSLMNFGTKPGTWIGEAVRMMAQFKGFAISYMDRGLLEGFKDADSKVYFALQQLGFVVPLSYLSTMMYYGSKGLTMPDPEQMSFPDKVSFWAGIMAPGFGIFSGILDTNNQNQNLVTSMLMTPSIRLMSQMMAAPLALATGKPELAGNNFLKAMQYAVPGSAQAFGNPYVQAALGNETYLQPGQKPLFGG